MKIYAANIEAFEAIQENTRSDLMGLTDSARRERIGRLKQKKDQIQSLVAGLLLRFCFLQEGYTEQQWEKIEIQTEPSGKPKLVHYPEFCYSLSHSGKWVICGVHSKALGADIQEMKPCNLQVAKRFFAPREYEMLLADESKREENFYKMWTAKESYVKLTGEGIGKGVSQFQVSKGLDEITDVNIQETAHLKFYDNLSDYMICVCARETQCFPDEIEIVPTENLT